jgi:hypothetical protein
VRVVHEDRELATPGLRHEMLRAQPEVVGAIVDAGAAAT